jgi:hypothetical protein
VEEERISIREFARRLGVSDTSVLKAYKAGKIVKGIVYPGGKEKPYVLPILACQEWGKNLSPDSGNNYHLIENIEKANKSDLKDSSKKVTVKKTVPITEEELASTPDIGLDGSLLEAKRIEAIYKAKLLKLEYLEKERESISLREVNKQLAEMAIKIRETFEALPNKSIDNILAPTGRNEALIVLTKVIKDALTKLSITELNIE